MGCFRSITLNTLHKGDIKLDDDDDNKNNNKGKVIPLQARCGPEGG